MAILFMIRDERQLKALTGVSREQFKKLRNFFAGVYEEILQKAGILHMATKAVDTFKSSEFRL